MTALRSLIFNLVFFPTSALIVTMLLLTLPFPRRVLQNGLRLWMIYMMALLKAVIGLEYEIRGGHNLPKGAAIIAAKHQSAWDTGVFLRILDDATYILKKELLSIPVYGPLLKKSEMVAIDRDGGGAALKQMIRDVRACLDENRQVIIFPEGTRSAVGSSLPYHPGVAALYKTGGAPVVPVALNSGAYWPRRAFLKKPGRIVLEYLEPMPTGLDRATFMAELENRIEQATSRLVAEAAAGG